MEGSRLQKYVDAASQAAPLDRYIPRKFNAASESGELPLEEFRFRGVFREREPGLPELLTHPRVLVLAEPGGGKSVIAKAAIHEVAKAGRIPIFLELKEYRGDLSAHVQRAAPDFIFQDKAAKRVYVLDGIDEIPAEALAPFADQLNKLLAADPDASCLATARQAFFVASRSLLPSFPAVFHVLEFSDSDIRQYAKKSCIDVDAFLRAADGVDVHNELPNPFILSILVERFRATGNLSDRRSEAVNFMVDRLIQSRPRVNAHRQRRALCMLAVALEVYSRNELTEEEALRVFQTSMHISDGDARELLGELYGSILKRTANGLAFQMRSYGEYLAAEELERAAIDRVRELAFLDYNTPNESWLNAISYLAELNAAVRTLFVQRFPSWMLHASPAAFSEEERTAVASRIMQALRNERLYVRADPRLNVRQLARFITPDVEAELQKDLSSGDDVLRGNALMLLGVRKRLEVVPLALDIIKDQTLGAAIRQCAVIAIVNAGNASHVPELMAALVNGDTIYNNVVDAIGSLVDEAQLPDVMPLLIRTDAGLSSAYYHFRELRSRAALVAILAYFVGHPDDFNSLRVGGYIDPILAALPEYFDDEIADLCVDLFWATEEQKVYPDRTGPMQVLTEHIREADSAGEVARRFFQRELETGKTRQGLYYIDQLLVSIMTIETARWLVGQRALDIIQKLSPFVGGSIRELLRPHSGGAIDAQDENARKYAAEREEAERAKRDHIQSVQERVVTRTVFADAVNDLQELKEDHWPELSEAFKLWLAGEITSALRQMDLEQHIRWEGNTLWLPTFLRLLLSIVKRYELRLESDELLIFVASGADGSLASEYYKRFGFSDTARQTLERLLAHPPSPMAGEELIRFVETSGFWSEAAADTLRTVVTHPMSRNVSRTIGLRLLAAHTERGEFFIALLHDPDPDIARIAFEILVDRQHRPTIERALSDLLRDDARLISGETPFPNDTPLGWIGKIRSQFAWNKLVDLHEKALRLALDRVSSMIAETLAKMDRREAADVIRRQLQFAPPNWKHGLQARVIEQERAALIEQAQRTPFGDVLQKLRGSTSAEKLLLVCEGSTDQPVFLELLSQVTDSPDVLMDFVGGWPGLQKKDPYSFLRGAKEVIVVMDGDNGRKLRKNGRPLTDIARKEDRRLQSAGVKLRVLERYGIENYFTRDAVEKVVGMDLAAYFPLLHDVPVGEQLAIGASGFWYRVRKLAARVFSLPAPQPTQVLYAKSRNSEVAALLELERDLIGTDLHVIIHEVAATARSITNP